MLLVLVNRLQLFLRTVRRYTSVFRPRCPAEYDSLTATPTHTRAAGARSVGAGDIVQKTPVRQPRLTSTLDSDAEDETTVSGRSKSPRHPQPSPADSGAEGEVTGSPQHSGATESPPPEKLNPTPRRGSSTAQGTPLSTAKKRRAQVKQMFTKKVKAQGTSAEQEVTVSARQSGGPARQPNTVPPKEVSPAPKRGRRRRGALDDLMVESARIDRLTLRSQSAAAAKGGAGGQPSNLKEI